MTPERDERQSRNDRTAQEGPRLPEPLPVIADRKSTRLNSSHS